MGNCRSDPDVRAGRAIVCHKEVVRFPHGVLGQPLQTGRGKRLPQPIALVELFKSKGASKTYHDFLETLSMGFQDGFLDLFSDWHNVTHTLNVLRTFQPQFQALNIDVILCEHRQDNHGIQYLTFVDKDVALVGYKVQYRSDTDVLAGRAIVCHKEVVRFPDGVLGQPLQTGRGKRLPQPIALQELFRSKGASETYHDFLETLFMGFQEEGLFDLWHTENHTLKVLRNFQPLFQQLNIEVIFCEHKQDNHGIRYLTFVDKDVAPVGYKVQNRFRDLFDDLFDDLSVLDLVQGAVAHWLKPANCSMM